ncbi:DUF4440 domain-containing protein [Nakamurella sp. YIM 132087]|uniref:DUF4440 domain-containing protein n=1 Tax=Nakamurella alba TaxID=2665158 RepID=A0A7K1FQJ1_9ACTN|nr:nuclear transport factor 2 family protein [Nakamurella alba]MTD15054.1 DUF4440 domain-containing protein [Nakamurella alba]
MSTTSVPTTATADETAIRGLIEARNAAVHAGDADAVIANLTPDAITMTLAPPLRNLPERSHDADALRAWMGTFNGPVTLETTDLVVHVGGDVAFAHGLTRMTATPQGSDESFSFWYRSTVGLVRTGGEWKVAHEHESTPFLMDGSFLAATDLQP